MKFYELTYLISPNVSEKELKDITGEINGLIGKEGGKISQEPRPSRQRLSYPVKKMTDAFLITEEFYLEPGKMEKAEKLLREKKQILRYIILAKKPADKIKKYAPKRRPGIIPPPKTEEISSLQIKPKERRKIDLKEIDQRIEEILKE